MGNSEEILFHVLTIQAMNYIVANKVATVYQKPEFAQSGFRNADTRLFPFKAIQAHREQLGSNMLTPKCWINPEGAQLVFSLRVLQNTHTRNLILRFCQNEAASPICKLPHNFVEPVIKAGIVHGRSSELGAYCLDLCIESSRP